MLAYTDRQKRNGFSSIATHAFTFVNTRRAAYTFCIHILVC